MFAVCIHCDGDFRWNTAEGKVREGERERRVKKNAVREEHMEIMDRRLSRIATNGKCIYK